MKKILIPALLTLSITFFGCKNKEQAPTTAPAGGSEQLKVGIIFDKAGKDDKSFNNSAWVGGQRAEKELGILLKTVEPSDDSALEAAQDQFASRNFDLIIGIGFVHEEAIKKVAPRYPNVKFAIVDSVVDLPNVASLMFEEQEGSYLVGQLAAMKSKSGIIGFVGGMDIPLIHRFAYAYKAGAESINPKIKVIENYAGITVDAFNDPTKGKELANSQISQKADVIYQGAGTTGMGVFDAVEKSNAVAIGTDSNQNWIKPGKILTSMLKRVDNSVYDIIKLTKEGKFTAGIHHYSLKNQGVDYAMDEHNKSLITEDMIAKVEQTRKDIVDGKLIVPDYYKLKK